MVFAGNGFEKPTSGIGNNIGQYGIGKCFVISVSAPGIQITGGITESSYASYTTCPTNIYKRPLSVYIPRPLRTVVKRNGKITGQYVCELQVRLCRATTTSHAKATGYIGKVVSTIESNRLTGNIGVFSHY